LRKETQNNIKNWVYGNWNNNKELSNETN